MLNKIKGHHLLIVAVVVLVIYMMAKNASIRSLKIGSHPFWPGTAPEIGAADVPMRGGRYVGD